MRVGKGIVDLRDAPRGARERQLRFGELVYVEETDDADPDDVWVRVRTRRLQYAGWIEMDALDWSIRPTHRVAARASHAYAEPKVQAREYDILPCGAFVTVFDEDASWSRIAYGFMPTRHLTKLDTFETDPAAVALRLLGAPYLWGGDGPAGIDCSGLAQLAWGMCGRDVPADSGPQREALSVRPDLPERVARGDLIFWAGHVAIATGLDEIVHANGHHMAVATEPLRDAVERIAGAEGPTGGGPVIGFAPWAAG